MGDGTDTKSRIFDPRSVPSENRQNSSSLEILKKYTTKSEAFREITDLHRFAIISKSDRITDILEINTHITDRSSFLMRLALSMRGTAKDGNFITAREGITLLEGQLRELMIEHIRLTHLVNSIYKARDYSIFGALLPGGTRPVIAR